MLREARLRPEYAHLYPMLRVGAWEAAVVIADKVAAIRIQQLADAYVLHDRVLPRCPLRIPGRYPAASHRAYRRCGLTASPGSRDIAWTSIQV
jgi:hypothetical protein